MPFTTRRASFVRWWRWSSSLASALSIGSGGSVGREVPNHPIGAAVASAGGRLAGASRWQLATLVAAGGGAGIAATFNTPIGGVLFGD